MDFEKKVTNFSKSLFDVIQEAPKDCDLAWREPDWMDIDVKKVLGDAITDKTTVSTAQAIRFR